MNARVTISLVKKYAPEKLSDFCGNTKTIRDLYRAIRRWQLNPCPLFTGGTGVGKTSVGRWLSKEIQNAESIEKLKTSLDYREYDCTNFRGIDDIRHIVGLFRYGFSMHQNPIAFFDECHQLTREAQHALLKPISELKEGRFVFFATSEPDRLIDPLRGRCTRYHLEPPTEDELVRFLRNIAHKEGQEVNAEILTQIAMVSRCRPREALNTLERVIGLPLERQKDILNQSERLMLTETSKSVDGPVSQQRKPNIAMAPLGHPSGYMLSPVMLLKALEGTACTSTQLLERHFKPVTCYLHPFLSEGSLIMLYARAGVGKTWLTMYLALLLTRRCAKEHCIENIQVKNQSGVVVIDGEMKTADLQSRLAALAGPMGEENPETPLTIVTCDDLFLSQQARINISEEQWREAIYSYMVKHPEYKVLILDNFSALCPGLNEYSKTSWDSVSQWMLSLRSIGVAVIGIHHATKTTGSFRGSSSLIDTLDVVIELKRGQNVPADELFFEVNFKKIRSGKYGHGQSFSMKALPHPENDEWLIWEQVGQGGDDNQNVDDQRDQLIMAQVILNEKSQTEIAEEFGVSQPKVSKLKKRAKRQDLINESGELTDKGKLFLDQFKPDDSGLNHDSTGEDS